MSARSYATTGTKRRFVAVLGLPPVDSAVMAVRASILADDAEKVEVTDTGIVSPLTNEPIFETKSAMAIDAKKLDK